MYCAEIEIANKIQFMKCSGVQNGHNIKVRSPKYSKLAAAAAEVQEPGSRTTETLFREQFRFCGVNIRILSEFYQNFIVKLMAWQWTGEAGGGKGRCVGSLWVTLRSL